MVAHLKMDLFETEILCWKASFSGFMLVFLRCPWMCFLMFFDNFQFPKSYRIPQLVVEFWNPLQNSLLPSLGKIMIRVFSVCPTKWFFVGLGKNECCFLIGKKLCVSNALSCKFFDFPMSKHRNIAVFKLPSLKKNQAGNHGKKLFALFLFRFPLFFFWSYVYP